MSKRDIAMKELLAEKAKGSPCTYKVSAIALDKKGNVLGHSCNTHSTWNVLEKTVGGRPGTGIHAERRLIERYQGVVKTIVICRVGWGGEIRPIDPCPVCAKVAKKYGVRIVSVSR